MRVNLTCRDQNSQVVEDWRKSVPQDPAKVAQYEVLENYAKRHVRPASGR
jgi:hypothetical protein